MTKQHSTRETICMGILAIIIVCAAYLWFADLVAEPEVETESTTVEKPVLNDQRQAKLQADAKRYFQQNFSQTSWYVWIDEIRIRAKTLEVDTSLSKSDFGYDVAAKINRAAIGWGNPNGMAVIYVNGSNGIPLYRWSK